MMENTKQKARPKARAVLSRSIKLDAVRLKAGEPCSHKRHFRGVLREVISYLELLAQNDPEYFVWATVEDIVEHCQRYHGKRYQRREVEYALDIFRRLWIVSGIVKRVRGGVEREGRVVAPHFAVFHRSAKNRCSYAQHSIPGQRTLWTFKKTLRGAKRSYACWKKTFFAVKSAGSIAGSNDQRVRVQVPDGVRVRIPTNQS
ncbi:MAG: hypothetical protein WCE53_15420 [Candidatus Acidiferrum sp.]